MLDQPDKTTDAWRRHLKRRPVTPCPLQQNCRWQLQRYGSAIAIDCKEDSPRDMAPDAPIRIIDEYVLSHIWSGKGLYCAEGCAHETRLHAGMLVLIPPGRANVLAGIPHTNYHEDYVLFSGEAFDRMAAAGLLQGGTYPWDGARFLPALHALMHKAPPEGHFRATLQLQRLLLQLPRGKPAHASPENRLRALTAEMAAHPERWWSIHDMAAFCGCSDSLLRHAFLQKTGLLPKRYAEKVKLEEAARRLAQHTPMEEVWRGLGFRDRSHFSHRFKAFFGAPPGHFCGRHD